MLQQNKRMILQSVFILFSFHRFVELFSPIKLVLENAETGGAGRKQNNVALFGVGDGEFHRNFHIVKNFHRKFYFAKRWNYFIGSQAFE